MAHYSDSHKGFCIEFKKAMMSANHIVYSNKIPELNLIYCLDIPKNGLEIGVKVQKALQIKLNEWAYEKEYRVFLPNKLRHQYQLIDGLKMAIPYAPECVESLIFGCKMPQKTQDYIMANYSFNIKFKKAVERKSYIEIIELKGR